MDGYELFCLAFLGVGAILAFMVYGKFQRADQGIVVYREYQDALEALKEDPTNPDLKQEALAIGRAYSNLSRENGRTMFDEVALMNDINAATASAQSVTAKPSNNRSVEERIQELVQLRDKGLVDEAEFNARKSKILEAL